MAKRLRHEYWLFWQLHIPRNGLITTGLAPLENFE